MADITVVASGVCKLCGHPQPSHEDNMGCTYPDGDEPCGCIAIGSYQKTYLVVHSTNYMKKDEHGNFIGVGETTAVEILRDIYKTAKIVPQYPFVNLINDDYKDSLGDNYLKHKLDIVVFRDKDKTIVVRVQDKHHEGVLTSARDIVMKQILEWNDCIVVDLNWYECHFLWKEEKNDDSISEVIISLQDAGLEV